MYYERKGSNGTEVVDLVLYDGTLESIPEDFIIGCHNELFAEIYNETRGEYIRIKPGYFINANDVTNPLAWSAEFVNEFYEEAE